MTGKPKAAEAQVLSTAPATDMMEKTAKPTTASASQPKAPITKPASANNDEQKKVTSYASMTGKPKASEGNVLATAPATDKLEKTAMPTTASASQPKAPIPKPAPANNDEQKKVSSYAATTGKPKAAEALVLATAPATDKLEKTAMPTTASPANQRLQSQSHTANNDEQKKVSSYAPPLLEKTAMPTTASASQPKAAIPKPAPANNDEQKKVSSYAATTVKPKAAEALVLATAPATDKMEKTECLPLHLPANQGSNPKASTC
ncbi:hypothetical protein BSL78_14250 [Apostichopus japonicus]|uniref:Uncharacterized protein n=1 Tax=Stichopus japonicus TaxID=307972 RepID=A0A2G8KLI7_STIJA|nr:hypothetical protein BSL78_14250 [Apostichopus japonicus]